MALVFALGKSKTEPPEFDGSCSYEALLLRSLLKDSKANKQDNRVTRKGSSYIYVCVR